MSEAPLSFYYIILVYFQDYSPLCHLILPHMNIIILDIHFIQTEIDTSGFHGPEHVQKGTSVPNQNLPGCALLSGFGPFPSLILRDIPPLPADVCCHRSSPLTAIFSCGFYVSHSITQNLGVCLVIYFSPLYSCKLGW